MNRTVSRAFWAVAFLVVLLAPLGASIGAGGGAGLPLELSMVLGLVPGSLLVVLVVLVSRLRSLTGGFGIEGLLRLHRLLGLLMLLLVVGHVAMVVVADPHNLGLLDLVHAPDRARAATVSTAALGVLAALAVARGRLPGGYERWRRVHVLLALVVVVGAALHVLLLHHLVVNPLMRLVLASLIAGLAVVLARRWLLRPLLAGHHRFRVREIRVETAEVSTLVLTPAGRRRQGRRRDRMRFAPGQFAWLRLRPTAPLAEEHPFTIASAPSIDGTIEFTVRHAGDWTGCIGDLRPGRSVYLDGPHGSFTVDHTHATGLVLIAGGVGITPMMSMLRTLASRGDPRPHRLVLSGRTPADILFGDELTELAGRLNLTVVQTVTRPPSDWAGRTGRISAALLAEVLPGRARRRQLDYFLCGSPALVDGAAEALDVLEIPAHRVHTERFDMV